MSSAKKLSLTSAILINLNVMIGAGVFINTYKLSADAGGTGFLLYPIVGILMIPLIAVIGKLVGYYPTGGLYAFAKDYSPYLGFLSCWSYFFGKLASACVMITFATTMFQQLIPALQSTNPLLIKLAILGLFTLLNLQNMKVGIIIQTFFLSCKSIPLLFAIIAGVLYGDTSAITINFSAWQGMAMNIPLALYCLAGFETACSLSRNMENPSVNGPKAVYYSFSIIMALYGIFQAYVYMNSYHALGMMSSYDAIFPSICEKIFNNPVVIHKISILLSFAMGSSALGGAYGILFSNPWNLFTLAEHQHTFAASTIKQLNKHHTPWIAVLAESIICLIFLYCNQGPLVPLQRTAALGIVIAYTISTFAYFKLMQRQHIQGRNLMIAYAAFATCMLFVTSCIVSFLETGLAPLMLFITILMSGTIMFIATHKK